MASYDDILQEAQRRYSELEARPWIRVGAAVCGEAAGAMEVADAFRSQLESRGIAASVSPVGCLGLCYAEPLVDIQKPGGPRIFYRNISPEQVSELIESCVVGDDPAPTWPWATWATGLCRASRRWKTCPSGVARCGWPFATAATSIPLDIYQYIANGGYAALAKAVSQMEPQDVIQEVQTSGLRAGEGRAFQLAPSGASSPARRGR